MFRIEVFVAGKVAVKVEKDMLAKFNQEKKMNKSVMKDFLEENSFNIQTAKSNLTVGVKEVIKEPKLPETVLFGLILVNFLPPIVFPIIYPPISEKIHTNKINKVNSNPCL